MEGVEKMMFKKRRFKPNAVTMRTIRIVTVPLSKMVGMFMVAEEEKNIPMSTPRYAPSNINQLVGCERNVVTVSMGSSGKSTKSSSSMSDSISIISRIGVVGQVGGVGGVSPLEPPLPLVPVTFTNSMVERVEWVIMS